MEYSQTDIAPTLARILGLEYDVPSGEGINILRKFAGEKVLLAIFDSLDWSVYTRYARPAIERIFGGSSCEFKVSSLSEKTSPSIATILTGLPPEEHEILSTENARETKILNLPEFAEEEGIKTTVVMEAEGALAFSDALDRISAVEDTDDVDVFDRRILNEVEDSVAQFEFIVCHLRTIDEYLHQNRSKGEIEEGLEGILERVVKIADKENFLLIVTGDHKAHGNVLTGSRMLPVIFLDFGSLRFEGP